MNDGVSVALSLGCPSGIGPEVAVRAAASPVDGARVVLVGDLGIVRRAAAGAGLEPSRFVAVSRFADRASLGRATVGVLTPAGGAVAEDHAPLGRPTPEGGRAQLAWIDAALDLVARGEADAIATGPAGKSAVVSSASLPDWIDEAARDAARTFRGHTEHLQRRLGADEVVMAFAEKRFTTALATTHLPLRAVPDAVTPDAVARATYWLADYLLGLAGGSGANPRVVVCGLNPHAGEDGLLGDEEGRAIVPGVAKARARLGARASRVSIVGPIPSETAFRVAAAGQHDGVVAMYHDQATIPTKLLGFGDAVNVSLGLGIVRTSVDHGTGYDRAASFTADPAGMRSAIDLAARMVSARRGIPA